MPSQTTADDKNRFLSAFQFSLHIDEALKASHTSERELNKWRRHDPEFAERFELTNVARGDFLEERMFNILAWATKDAEGYKLMINKPTLLTFALKGLKREKYGDRGGAGGEDTRRLLESVLALSDKSTGEAPAPDQAQSGIPAHMKGEIEQILEQFDN